MKVLRKVFPVILSATLAIGFLIYPHDRSYAKSLEEPIIDDNILEKEEKQDEVENEEKENDLDKKENIEDKLKQESNENEKVDKIDQTNNQEKETNEDINDDQKEVDEKKTDLNPKLEISPEKEPNNQKANNNFNAEDKKVIITWNHYNLGKGFYNPDDVGKKVSFDYWIIVRGEREDGNIKTGYIPRRYNGVIGDVQTIDLNIQDVVDVNGNKFKTFELVGIDFLPNRENPIYGISEAVSVDGKQVKVQFTQNMNTKTTGVIKKDSIILDKDKNKINVIFTASRTSDKGIEDPVKGNDSKVITHSMNFNEGDMEVYGDLMRPGSFSKAIFQNALGIFSPYTGRYQTYKLKANFADPSLEDRYELSMDGDDVKGWTLTLSSKIKEDEKIEETKLPFTIKYIDDPSLIVGTNRIIKNGKEGKKIVKTSYYYIIKDGEKIVLEEKDPIITTIDPIDQIVIRGRKIPDVIIPGGDNSPEEDNKKPDDDNKPGEDDKKPDDNNKPEDGNKENNPGKDNQDKKPEKNENNKKPSKNESKSRNQNPKTGVGSLGGIFAILLSATSGLFVSNRKNK